MAQTYVKSATEVASFSINWSDALGSATISTSAWAVDTGITKDSDSKTNTVATIVLSSGTAGTTYTCTNTITTSASETWVDTLYIIVPSTTMYQLFRQMRDYKGVGEATDDGLLFNLLERAFQMAETYCERKFEATTATRYYEMDAVDGDYLYLDDDLISVTTLTNGDDSATTIGSDYYWLWPRNDSPPYWAIRLKDSQTTYSWERDEGYFISVLGSWGWGATVPADVAQAIIRLTTYYYDQKDAGVYDVTAFPAEGVITVPQGMPRDVKLLLDPYRRFVG